MGSEEGAAGPLVLTPEVSPNRETQRVIEAGLIAYNEAIASLKSLAPLWIVGRDGAGTVQAGLHGTTVYNWLCVHGIWVAEPYRRQGIGSQLLLKAEALARDRLCAACCLETFSFQAPQFYEMHGYQEVGRLEGFPEGHTRIWFSKPL